MTTPVPTPTPTPTPVPNITRELCKSVTAGQCIDPTTGFPYTDATTRCSALNSGTPLQYLCYNFLGNQESVNALTAEICAAEPTLRECANKNVSTILGDSRNLIFILGGGLVLLIIVALLSQRSQDQYYPSY